MATVEDYTGLIPAANAAKARFMAMVAMTAQPFVDLVNLLTAVPAAFDVDTAVGTQLDTCGQLVGVSRDLPAPLTGVYFALDTAGVGFDSGVWKGPYDPASGLVKLPDEWFRLLVKAKILNNSWDGSREKIPALAETIFAPLGYTYIVEDRADLTIRISLLGVTKPPQILASLVTSGALDLKPLTIQVASYTIAQAPIFALDANSLLYKGFDAGAWAE